MKHMIALLGALSLFIFSGCSSLPEGSQKPFLQIDKLSLADNSKEPGFNLEFTMEHHSLEALPIREYKVDIFVNGTKAATYSEEPKNMLLQPNTPVNFRSYIPANLMHGVAAKSLQQNSYVVVEASCIVTVVFDEDEDNYDFNPSGSFEGMISHD